YAESRQSGRRQLLRQSSGRRRTAQNAPAGEGREGGRQGEERQGVRGTAQEARREARSREKTRALDLSRREERPGSAAARPRGVDAGEEEEREDLRGNPCSSKAARSSSQAGRQVSARE